MTDRQTKILEIVNQKKESRSGNFVTDAGGITGHDQKRS